MTDKQRSAVIAEALSWDGTPYHDHATIKGVGADCAMMPLMVYKAALPSFPQDFDPPKYVRQWHLHRGEETFLDCVLSLGAIEVKTPEPGDFALWKIGRVYSHGGVVLDWPNIIHAVVGIGVIKANACTVERLRRAEPRFFTWEE